MSGTANLMTVTSTGSSVARTEADRFADTVNVLDFGTPTQMAANAAPYLQAAINFAITNNKKIVYLPSQVTYYMPYTGSPGLSVNVPAGQQLEIVGGAAGTVLQWQEGTGTTYGGANWQAAFYNANTVTPAYGSLVFRKILFTGTFGSGGTVNAGGAALALNAFQSIHLYDCTFQNICCFATTCEFIQEVIVMGCVFNNCVRDMARFRSSFNVTITNNHFIHGGDDAVALHSNYTLTANNTIREGIVVSNNIFEDTCGISCLGGRVINISHNIMRRVKVHGVWIAYDSVEGTNPIFALSIEHNDFYDMLPPPPMASATQLAIAVSLKLPASGTLPVDSGGVAPGQYSATTGTFTQWYPYRWVNSATAGSAFPNLYGLKIASNRIMRTLPAVTNYSDWGYGEVISPNTPVTGYSDPAVTDAAMRPYEGIGINTFGIGVQIVDNQIWYVNEGIEIVTNMPDSNSFSAVISRNQFYDIGSAAMRFHGTVENAADLIITDNTFDLDPYMISSARTQPLDGTWISTSDIQPAVIYGTTVDGIQFSRNIIKNALAVSSGLTLDGKDNVLVCQPVAAGTNTGNAGIQKLPVIGPMFRLQYRQCNPTQDGYGGLLNNCLVQSASMPSTGFYLIGHFCQATGSASIYGWYRLTSSSNHVLGTDWLPVMLSACPIDGNTSMFSGNGAVHAAGTTSGSATLLNSVVNLVTTAGPLANGIRCPNIPSASTSGSISAILGVDNASSVSVNLFPQTGGGFRGLSTDAPYTVSTATSVIVAVAGAGQWIVLSAS